MKRWIIALAAGLLCSLGLEAQKNDSYVQFKLVEVTPDTLYLPKALGLRTGFFTTIGVSYNQFFNRRMAYEINLGYRLKNGWLGQGPNTRIGLEAVYQYHYPLILDHRWLSVFGRAGVFAGQADYSYREPSPYDPDPFFFFGITAGLGLDAKLGMFNLSGWFSPGIDLTNPVEPSNRFFLNRTSGIAVRILL